MPPSVTQTETLQTTLDNNGYSLSAAILGGGAHSHSKSITAQDNAKLPTFQELRQAIPAHCFRKDTFLSYAYLACDFAMIYGMYLMVPYFERFGGYLGLAVWWWLMGMFGCSLFMIGHDCGHESFSDSQFWSDIAGHLAMAPIQTPYWPMAKSHRQHHNFTNHMEKDKGYFWTTEEDYVHAGWFERNFSKIPLSNFLKWNLMHLFMGIPDGSLFWPYSKLFKNNVERLQCVISGFTCFFCIFVAFRMCNYSFIDTGKYYLMPVLFQGFWMVMLTTLQHQDEEAEVYEDGAWTYVKGQVQTIDRVYGLGVDWVLHHVTDCHVVHHFFTKIPHYHLVEANEAVRKVFDRYPGVYKRRHCYHYLIEFLRLNCVLEYLVRKENGLRKFNASVDFYGRAAPKAA